ncbi:hypothetical protein [Enterococcus sp. BWR-S5]|uniref:hypothetical protein n=1 Tax=Enterococcus sp. BWR-S5 TaxID=2787714 RepID=UPI00192406BF|nr:hypothetical protein [Enterococcus sp. BWR-S5]MBL1223963.1 hypothetical protein [Enterococcus sp. BWR-S5]
MLKKSVNFKGYVFAESLIALSMMTAVISGLLSVNHILFSKTLNLNNELLMQRVLYEEMMYVDKYGQVDAQEIHRNGKNYYVTIVQEEEKWIKAEIRHEKAIFSIERR